MEGCPAELASVAHHVIGDCDGSSIGSFLKAEVLGNMDESVGPSNLGMTPNPA